MHVTETRTQHDFHNLKSMAPKWYKSWNYRRFGLGVVVSIRGFSRNLSGFCCVELPVRSFLQDNPWQINATVKQLLGKKIEQVTRLAILL